MGSMSQSINAEARKADLGEKLLGHRGDPPAHQLDFQLPALKCSRPQPTARICPADPVSARWLVGGLLPSPLSFW